MAHETRPKGERYAIWASWAFVGCIILFFVVRAAVDWKIKHDWEKFKAELVAQGVKINPSDFAGPPIPDEKNFAKTRIFQAELSSEARARQKPGFNFLTIGPNDYQIGFTNSTPQRISLKSAADYYRQDKTIAAKATSDMEAVRLGLSPTDALVSELLDSIQRPQMDTGFFRSDLSFWGRKSMYMFNFRYAAKNLFMRALVALEQGDTQSYMRHWEGMLQLAEHVGGERHVVSMMIKNSQMYWALELTWIGLESGKLNEQQIETMQNRLASVRLARSFREAWIIDTAWSVSYIDAVLAGTEDLPPKESGSSTSFDIQDLDTYWPTTRNTIRQMQTRSMQMSDVIKDVEGRIQDCKDAGVWSEKDQSDFGRLRTWRERGIAPSTEYFTGISPSRNRVLAIETVLRMAEIACALERYRLQNKTYPVQLNDLVPKYMSQVPDDPASACPFRYRLNPDGSFVLYSPGLDGVDHGGRPSAKEKSWIHTLESDGDWVWTYGPVVPSGK